MIFLYSAVVVLLLAARKLVRWRVKSLEKSYSRVAKTADKTLHATALQGGLNKTDPYQLAKRQYQLGQLAAQRDRLEAKYESWQTFADKFGRAVDRIRGWKGRKLPYTFGALDVGCLLYAIDALGARDYVNPQHLVQVLTSWFAGG